MTADVYSGYYMTEPEEIRVRKRNYTSGSFKGTTQYSLTIKGKGALVRKELETRVSSEFFDLMEKSIGIPFIHKDYYVYNLDNNLKLEVSVVDYGSPSSFVFAEVEFKTEEEAQNFEFPFKDILIKEITHDKGYRMASYWYKRMLAMGLLDKDKKNKNKD